MFGFKVSKEIEVDDGASSDTGSTSSERSLPQCWGHRGASAAYPENTLASFEAAIRDGAEGIESDVHITSDNIIVMLHDPLLDRTTDGKGLVKRQPYLDGVDKVTTTKLPKQPVPTFAATVEMLMRPENRHVILNIDVKPDNDPERLFRLMDSVIRQYDDFETTLSPRLVLGLWHNKFVEPALTILPSLRLAHIGVSTALARKYFWACSAFSLNFSALVTKDGEDFRRECKNANKEVYCWTINKRNEMIEATKWGVDAILTDRTAEYLKLRDQMRTDWDTISKETSWLIGWTSIYHFTFVSMIIAAWDHFVLTKEAGAFVQPAPFSRLSASKTVDLTCIIRVPYDCNPYQHVSTILSPAALPSRSNASLACLEFLEQAHWNRPRTLKAITSALPTEELGGLPLSSFLALHRVQDFRHRLWRIELELDDRNGKEWEGGKHATPAKRLSHARLHRPSMHTPICGRQSSLRAPSRELLHRDQRRELELELPLMHFASSDLPQVSCASCTATVSREKPSATMTEQAEIDHSQTTPFLLRVFAQSGRHHDPSDFEGNLPVRHEHQVYTWRDTTIRDIVVLLLSSRAPKPIPLRYSVRQVYFDRGRGCHASKELALIFARDLSKSDEELGNTARLTLEETRFAIGDYIDVAYWGPGHGDEKSAPSLPKTLLAASPDRYRPSDRNRRDGPPDDRRDDRDRRGPIMSADRMARLNNGPARGGFNRRSASPPPQRKVSGW
ncbi:uncharacterized protein L969DRAFT_91664 [Mixia osmundae IAM 14324]|uniref:GP-PDE domain-containing protein n=1 Tax=Mixia osmundae (strain CBS 9802 / IAM 14324 / JCM 22182 / KY 12970) TaxID=764103 RepID=G7E051_MIXOS|nr:uncharacterized protein L969DRAFT_91664 [Mixia osmundae IAM 14324]KEI42203.1 hypothetical protein L969DRAFT_91664 [Mixia osmundae IAM 14324]GAA96211.1 hypothetical protein E5Q_02875 [Mixia osmundae IAM 14324]